MKILIILLIILLLMACCVIGALLQINQLLMDKINKQEHNS